MVHSMSRGYCTSTTAILLVHLMSATRGCFIQLIYTDCGYMLPGNLFKELRWHRPVGWSY